MQLFYRGIPYEKTDSISGITEEKIGYKYRGREFTYHYPRHIPQVQPGFDLRYRGVSYGKMSRHTGENQDLVGGENNLICSVPIRRPMKIEDNLNQVHWENIKRNLERRIEVAQSRGDLDLVDLLKKEQLTLEFS